MIDPDDQLLCRGIMKVNWFIYFFKNADYNSEVDHIVGSDFVTTLFPKVW